MRTQQEIFDLAWNGLKSQGFERSLGQSGRCAYRGDGGRKCAIGWCIPDERYDTNIEGYGAAEFRVSKPAGIASRDRDFARSLQLIHDEPSTSGSMEADLLAFALRHGLAVPPDAAPDGDSLHQQRREGV